MAMFRQVGRGHVINIVHRLSKVAASSRKYKIFCQFPGRETVMPRASGLRAVLFMTSALGCAGLATAAFAQAKAPTTNNSAIEEVVVTATRQTSTVNKVALSVSAVTQKNL